MRGSYDTRIAMIVTTPVYALNHDMAAIPRFQACPREIEEAAFVDGYGAYAIFLFGRTSGRRKSLIGADRLFLRFGSGTNSCRADAHDSDAKTLPIVASELSQLGFDVPWGILTPRSSFWRYRR